jgi:uncharacterized protein YjbI with pentapeptide repeats
MAPISGSRPAVSESRKQRGTRRQARAADASKIFTEGEKKALLVGHVFQGADLDGVDFSGADLRAARFENTSLRNCDFSATHLLDTQFLRCDLRGTCFNGAKFEHNRFDGSLLLGATGLSASLRTYIDEHGGSFLRVMDGRTAARESPKPPPGGEGNTRG